MLESGTRSVMGVVWCRQPADDLLAAYHRCGKASAGERIPVSSSGVDHPETTEPRRRERKRPTPLNVGVLGDTSGGMHSAKIARVGGEGSVEPIYHISYASHNSGGTTGGVLFIFSG